MSWLRRKIAFALLRAQVLCIRGSIEQSLVVGKLLQRTLNYPRTIHVFSNVANVCSYNFSIPYCMLYALCCYFK